MQEYRSTAVGNPGPRRDAHRFCRNQLLSVARIFTLSLVTGLLGLSGIEAQNVPIGSSTAPKAVRYDASRDQLSVSVADRPLIDLFEQISTETGVGLIVHGTDHGAITSNFDDPPLESAIRQLLEGSNFAMSGRADPEQTIIVWIMSPKGPTSMAPQARLRTAGATMDGIIKTTTFLTDMTRYREFSAVRAETFPKWVPASTAVATPALVLPDFLVEIEAIAIVGSGNPG